jgi:hypothetical protein
MIEYHKIQTCFLRDPETNYKRLLEGTWSKPEFDYLQDSMWRVDEKIDGTNIRIVWNGSTVQFKGKTDNATPINDLYATLATIFTPERLGEQFGTVVPAINTDDIQVCLYGEGYGPGIQKGGGNYRKDKNFILFDVKIGQLWLDRDAVRDIAFALKVAIVPEVGVMTLNEAIARTKFGFNSQFGPFAAEGIVARPIVELKNRRGERVITKLKSKDYTYEA